MMGGRLLRGWDSVSNFNRGTGSIQWEINGMATAVTKTTATTTYCIGREYAGKGFQVRDLPAGDGGSGGTLGVVVVGGGGGVVSAADDIIQRRGLQFDSFELGCSGAQ